MRLNWGTGIALVYTVFAACTTAFVVFALNHPVQLVREDYYATSLQHDSRRAAIENADALADLMRVGDDGRSVTLALPVAHVGDAAGRVRLYRPSDSAADRSLALAPDAGGRQRVSLDGLAAGRWVVQLDWTSGGQAFYREVMVMVQ
jgi:nitrogen fixation protein FixH